MKQVQKNGNYLEIHLLRVIDNQYKRKFPRGKKGKKKSNQHVLTTDCFRGEYKVGSHDA